MIGSIFTRAEHHNINIMPGGWSEVYVIPDAEGDIPEDKQEMVQRVRNIVEEVMAR